eukprot:1267712-Pyramimonas_sp.AAC.2
MPDEKRFRQPQCYQTGVSGPFESWRPFGFGFGDRGLGVPPAHSGNFPGSAVSSRAHGAVLSSPFVATAPQV